MRTRLAVLGFILPVLVAVRLCAGEIHTAALAGDLDKVRAILEADPASLESKDRDGSTPLHSACTAKQVAIANLLIAKGANVNARDKSGFTPLHCASRGQRLDFDLIQALIAKGADVNAQLDRGITALHWVAISDNLKVAKLLIDRGANLNAFDKDGYGTVLQMAINFGQKEEMAKLLVDSGAKLGESSSFGNTELHLAVMKGYAELARTLIKHGSDIQAVNGNNRTALYYAAKHGYRSVADALIAAGAKESAIGEANYGKAPQLTAALKEGEAHLWYLGGLIGGGYAVKTKDHLLLFNPSGLDDSPEAGLANGHINLKELLGQKITVFVTTSIGPDYEASFSELAKRMPGMDFVICSKPTASPESNGALPTYRLAAPHESFSVGEVQVHAIPASGRTYGGADAGGLGYLVEADGVKIFHAGFHSSSNKASQVAKFNKEIDFLKPFGPIDVAILSVSGHVSAAYQPYLYLLDQLSPKTVYLMGSDMTEEYPKCAEVLRARNIPVSYAEGGRALGERFHFLRDQAQATVSPEAAVQVNKTIRSGLAGRAQFQGLGDLPGGAFESTALRISADGSVVVGSSTTATGKQAFRWTQAEGMVSLGNLPDNRFRHSWAVSVSSDGSTIVGYGDPDGSEKWDNHRGFLWTSSGGMKEFPKLEGATRDEALGVSADGSVIVGDGGAQAFRWTRSDGIAGLGVLPGRAISRAIAVSADGSVATGSSYQLPSWDKEETFLWTKIGGMQGLGFLPGGHSSFPNAISADGTVVVGTSVSSSGSAPFRWTRSTGMVSLGHLPGRKTTHPGAVTADGAIVVGASFINRREPAVAFIWDAAHGIRSLQTVLETEYGLSLSGWHLQNASGITPDGSVIVGWGTNPSNQTEAFRVALKELPSRR